MTAELDSNWNELARGVIMHVLENWPGQGISDMHLDKMKCVLTPKQVANQTVKTFTIAKDLHQGKTADTNANQKTVLAADIRAMLHWVLCTIHDQTSFSNFLFLTEMNNFEKPQQDKKIDIDTWQPAWVINFVVTPIQEIMVLVFRRSEWIDVKTSKCKRKAHICIRTTLLNHVLHIITKCGPDLTLSNTENLDNVNVELASADQHVEHVKGTAETFLKYLPSFIDGNMCPIDKSPHADDAKGE